MDDRRQGAAVTPARAPVAAEYRARLDLRRAAADTLERGHERFSWLRLAIAAAVVAVLALGGVASWPWAAALAAAFLVVAYAHAQLLNRRDRARRAIDFYERGIARLEDRWQGDGDPGDRFRDAEHPSADDIDLFGPGSLFQLLSTPRTRGGEARLAAWLKAPAPPAEVTARQEAVRELAPRLDFREDVFVIGPDVRSAVDTEALTAWATSPAQLSASWPLAVLPVLVATTVSALMIWITKGEPPTWLVPAAAVQLAAGAWFHRRVMHVIGGIHWRVRELRVLASLLERMSQEKVSTGRLGPLAAALTATGHFPADEVRRLARLADLVVSRENQLFAPLAAILMVATHGAILVDRWRARCGAMVPAWIDAASEYEALLALAEFAADNPDAAYPEVTAGPPLFEAESMSHPLLPRARAVANTVRLGGEGAHVLLVSGSNMSGKSTLLRTVGITAALAQAGAPVLAARARLSPLDIGATLRIQDSLQEGRSRFFAEITRVSQVVAMARAARADPSKPGVLFLLDEVLSGTNSHDRRQGAEGVIRGLVALGAIGLVTTHDLALTEAVGSLDGAIVNVHFEDRFVDGVLHFDYQLRPGVVRTSNAIALMRSVGLDV